jgi:hypothetical protein
MIATKDWTPLYPSTHNVNPEQTRSVILISAAFASDSWQQLDFPSGDVTVVQVKGNWGKITIFNIYNDCQHNDTISLLSDYQHKNANEIKNVETGNAHCI